MVQWVNEPVCLRGGARWIPDTCNCGIGLSSCSDSIPGPETCLEGGWKRKKTKKTVSVVHLCLSWSLVTAAAWVTAMSWIPSPTWECQHASSMAKTQQNYSWLLKDFLILSLFLFSPSPISKDLSSHLFRMFVGAEVAEFWFAGMQPGDHLQSSFCKSEWELQRRQGLIKFMRLPDIGLVPHPVSWLTICSYFHFLPLKKKKKKKKKRLVPFIWYEHTSFFCIWWLWKNTYYQIQYGSVFSGKSPMALSSGRYSRKKIFLSFCCQIAWETQYVYPYLGKSLYI